MSFMPEFMSGVIGVAESGGSADDFVKKNSKLSHSFSCFNEVFLHKARPILSRFCTHNRAYQCLPINLLTKFATS